MTFTHDDDVPSEWWACHGQPHWMDDIPVPLDARHEGVIDAWYRCQRCTTERYDQLDPVTFKVLPGGRKYRHPPGYKTKGVSRAQWKARHLMLVGAISERQARRANAR